MNSRGMNVFDCDHSFECLQYICFSVFLTTVRQTLTWLTPYISCLFSEETPLIILRKVFQCLNLCLFRNSVLLLYYIMELKCNYTGMQFLHFKNIIQLLFTNGKFILPRKNWRQRVLYTFHWWNYTLKVCWVQNINKKILQKSKITDSAPPASQCKLFHMFEVQYLECISLHRLIIWWTLAW